MVMMTITLAANAATNQDVQMVRMVYHIIHHIRTSISVIGTKTVGMKDVDLSIDNRN
jgi:hypothetical protein